MTKKCTYCKPVDHIKGELVFACLNPDGRMRVEEYGMALCPFDKKYRTKCPDFELKE